MSASVTAMSVRSRFRDLVEAVLPWYDVDAERVRTSNSKRQIADSRAVRAAATRALHASRRDRALRGYVAYAHRVRR
jgi:hypothetical protein